MLYDTIELSKALQPTFTPEQAEVLVQALSKASIDQLATKADIVELKAEIATLRSDLSGEITTLRSDLTGEITTLRSDLTGEITTLRSDLTGEITTLRSDLTGEITTLRSDLTGEIVGMRGEIIAQHSLLRADTIKWIVSALAFNFVATAGLIITLTKVFGK